MLAPEHSTAPTLRHSTHGFYDEVWNQSSQGKAKGSSVTKKDEGESRSWDFGVPGRAKDSLPVKTTMGVATLRSRRMIRAVDLAAAQGLQKPTTSIQIHDSWLLIIPWLRLGIGWL